MGAKHRLASRFVTTVKEPGFYADGGGLYLSVTVAKLAGENVGVNRRWAFIFFWRKKRKEMGLGSLDTVDLATARAAAATARQQVAAGVNPIEARDAADRAALEPDTFLPFAEKLIADNKVGWKHAKHRHQWEATIKTYCKPIHAKLFDEITTSDILKILSPIWTTKNPTARKLRGRIERVIDAAKAAGKCNPETANPARWRGNLAHLLPKMPKQKGHYPALPYEQMPEFWAKLQKRQGAAARALAFTILTVAREAMTLEAPWSEIDGEKLQWSLADARMKVKAFTVPLTPGALAEAGDRMGPQDLVFPGYQRDPATGRFRPLSPSAMDKVIHRMGYKGIATVHGFRSTFRDWAGDCTHFQRETIEAVLAHAVGDETERAYRRRDALAKRLKVMEAWTAYVTTGKGARILQFNRAG